MSNRDESTIDNFPTFFRHCRKNVGKMSKNFDMSIRHDSTIDIFSTFFRHCQIDHGKGLACRTSTPKWGIPEVSCCQLDYWMKTLRWGTFCLTTCSGVLDTRHTRMLFWLLMVVSTLLWHTIAQQPLDRWLPNFCCLTITYTTTIVCKPMFHGAVLVVLPWCKDCRLSIQQTTLSKKCWKIVENLYTISTCWIVKNCHSDTSTRHDSVLYDLSFVHSLGD